MKTFTNIRFCGKFRDYQQGVIDRASKHLKDKKIHIVAAPGSGKTILGLELIRSMKSPALVFSPSVTIRQQWGERFSEMFLPAGENTSDYVSFDLKNPALITSITYQALHAAVTKQTMKSESEDEDESYISEASEDFSDFDIFGFLRSNGIKTICLDEAHHLKSEWQKALESFISEIKNEVTVISLTATPPYDSTPAEWNRYVELCGEIDEEIFVPQLIAQKTLCPHQDFIYFNYPTADEAELSKAYKIKGVRCAEEIIHGQLLADILSASGICKSTDRLEDTVLENVRGFAPLIVCADYAGKELPDKLIRLVAPSGKLPPYNIFTAEAAFRFVLDSPELFGKEISENLRAKLAENGLIDKKKVCLVSNEKINKQLVSSTGKLDSINTIVRRESENLGDKLRMLILTDYIKRDMLKSVGTSLPLTAMGTVPVFESVRRSCGDSVLLAMLSGRLVIIPNISVDSISSIAQEMGVNHTVKPLVDTSYSEIVFSGSNKNKVSVITAAFQKGLIHVLVGTKSLLGEGWDSPCINSLILASFVGSFMLSNQMRGRAIRTEKGNPDKVSNIWHLVTLEPEVKGESAEEQMLFKKVLYNDDAIYSDDFSTLQRRFNCFLAPAYHSQVIESGIDRIDILTPPFNDAGIANIDGQMLAISSDRKATAEQWFKSLHGSMCPEILDVVEIKNPAQPKSYIAKGVVKEILLAALLVVLIVCRTGLESGGFFKSVLSFVLLIAIAICAVFVIKGLLRILRHRNAEKTISVLSKDVLKALKKINEIESNACVTVTKASPDNSDVYCMLSGSSIHEKKVFSSAVSELLSPVDDPRYVLIKKGLLGQNYSHCYACPSVLGTKKENVEVLARCLKSSTGSFIPFYTRGDSGRKEMLKCRKHSYINASATSVRQKKIAK